MVWLPQLDWEVREPGKERDGKGHRRLSSHHTHTPSWGVRKKPHPHQSLNLWERLRGRGYENGRDSLLTLNLGGEGYEEVQSWGRSPPS